MYAADISDDLPSLLLRQGTPRGHALPGFTIFKNPGQLTIRCVGYALVPETWPVITTLATFAVALGTIVMEEMHSGVCRLLLRRIRIHALAVGLRHFLEPGTICGRHP